VSRLYYSSFDTTLNNYKAALQDNRAGISRLANIDFDTGNYTTPGEYGLADKNYDLLVAHLQKNNLKLMRRELKENVIDYYSHRVPPTGSRKMQKKWTKTEAALQQIEKANVGETD